MTAPSPHGSYCPNCEATLVNVQGVELCSACGWSGGQ